MKTIAIVSSPLQLAVFNASSVLKENTTIIGNRGIKGDLTYEQSVLNDAKFIAVLDKLIGSGEVELFIPNSLNLIYFFAVTDKRVKRISFVDEGRLTKRFLQGGDKKARAKHHGLVSFLMRGIGLLPKVLRHLPYKLTAYLFRKYMVQRYECDTLTYPYRTIERSEKPGVLLSHEKSDIQQEWVEFVDLTKDLDFPLNYENRACLFLHPRHVTGEEWLQTLVGLYKDEAPLLLRPHPNFTRAPELLENVFTRLKDEGIQYEIAEVSGQQDVAIELYARGVRRFYCGETSITDTVEAYPDYFQALQVVKI